MGKLLAAATSGLLALFSMYWDDSLHTDVGRDTFWSPPHVLLYGSLTVTLAAVAWWGWPRVRRQGLRGAATDPLLRWVAASGASLAIAAPADAAWHTAFGPDSVLWSPPHLLAIVATFALTVTLLRAIAEQRGGFAPVLGGALLLGAALAPVMEYESDVPQFSTVWFLPAVSTGLTLALVLLRRFDGRTWAATRAALLLTAVRLLTVAVLAGLGHSTPIVPPVLAVAVVADLVHRWRTSLWWLPAAVPLAVHVAYVPLLPVMPHGSVVTAHQIAPSLAVAVVGSALAVLAAEGVPRNWYRGVQVAGMVSALLLLPLLSATTVLAHDPGQGTAAGTAQWRGFVRGHSIEVRLTTTNRALTPDSLVARRAGDKLTGRLMAGPAGTYRGSIAVHTSGRWFVYATFRDERERRAETWIPVERDTKRDIRASRPLYLPPTLTYGAGRVAATTALYGLAAVILVAVARAGRSRLPN